MVNWISIVGAVGIFLMISLILVAVYFRFHQEEEEISYEQAYAETIIDYLYSLEQPNSEYSDVSVELRSIKVKVPADCDTTLISKVICEMDSNLKAHDKGFEGEDKIMSIGFK